MSIWTDVKKDIQDFIAPVAPYAIKAFNGQIAVLIWIWGRIKPFIKWYVSIIVRLVKFILTPVRWFFPYRLRDMFKYPFEQMFLHRPYWKDVNAALFSNETDPERHYLRFFLLLAMVSPLSLPLALLMYVLAYHNLKLRDYRVPPVLDGQPRLVFVAMIFGALIPLYIIAALGLSGFVIIPVAVYHSLHVFWYSVHGFINGVKLAFGSIFAAIAGLIAIVLALIAITPVLLMQAYINRAISLNFFNSWRQRINQYLFDVDKFGSARFASPLELSAGVSTGEDAKGIYVGQDNYYNKSGHLLTVAGTRGGKGTNLIIPNLLKIGRFEGSFVIIDPKGENAAVTARIQKEQLGRNVVVLNPWNLLLEDCPHLKGMTYNPLDLLTNKDDDNFVDDAMIIAEMIVPINKNGGKDKFFEERSRSVVAGFIMHIVDSETKERKNLGTLYESLRLDPEAFKQYCADMAASDIFAVKAVANELLSLKGSENAYSSVIASVHSYTDFLKSPPLQRSLTSSTFNVSQLADGNTALYVIIPADKLTTHYQWLRLVITTALRSVIRKPNKDVCFILDEFYALGFISEVDTALGTYAGYGVHIWAILQNLIQLQDMYDKNWESFISSCSVRHFFNVTDNFSTGYLSQLFGQTTLAKFNVLGQLMGAEGRALINPDEIRRASSGEMFTVIDYLSPARLRKQSYLEMPQLVQGVDYDANPYHKKDKGQAPIQDQSPGL